jgi:hypothetical protein
VIVGSVERFAIEASIERLAAPSWVFGRMRFWLGGSAVGDWESPTALNGCVGWLREFCTEEVDRRDGTLFGLPAAVLLGRITSGFVREGVLRVDSRCDSQGLIRRFYLSHLGMSAFDKFDLALVESCDGRQRMLWSGEGASGEVELAPREMEFVVEQFCLEYDLEVGRLGG